MIAAVHVAIDVLVNYKSCIVFLGSVFLLMFFIFAFCVDHN